MKPVPRSRQHHDLYRKYNGQDSKISGLLGECRQKGLTELPSQGPPFSTVA
jgi:hypothetical protein